MGEGSAGSPIIGTPTSPFGNMDFAGPRVISPVHSPPTDPFGEVVNFGASMGDNPAVSPFDALSPGGRVTTPMQPSSGAGSYRGAGMDGKESGFVGSHTDHFQGLDPFDSMGSINQHATHRFGDMSAAASMETWGDLGAFAKEEPSSDATQFDAMSPAPRSNDMAQTPVNFASQGYFDSQPPQPQPRLPQQHPQPRPRPRPVPSQPPARPAKKPFLRQQDTAGLSSTPGFNIWKPPVPSTPKPAIGNPQQHSSAVPSASNAPFLPQSQPEVKVEIEDDLLSQPYNADIPVASPSNVMPSSVTSPTLDTPSAASPVRPLHFPRPVMSLTDPPADPPSSTCTTPAGSQTLARAGARRSVGSRKGDDPPVVPRGAEAAERSDPGDGRSTRLPGYVCRHPFVPAGSPLT